MQQRLFEITYLLTARGRATAAELAEKLGVSRRTIYRDIDALSSAGIPVYAEKGKGGGIRMLPDFVLDKSMFSRDERTQLVSHFQSLASIGTPDTQPLLDKLSALFGPGDEWLAVDFAPWDGGDQARDLFRTLRDAILQRRLLQIRYTGANGESVRNVEPHKIIFRGQGWYLYAFCRLRNDFRFFKLSRIRAPQSLAETFKPRPAQEHLPQPYTGPRLDVVLRFEASAAFRIYDEFPLEQIQRTPQGDFEVRASFPTGEWLAGYLLSFGSQVEVLKPASLRQQIKQTLLDMSSHYKGD